jgi:diadenosine tetraphosphate (Ap4A) HIT family hydrolase
MPRGCPFCALVGDRVLARGPLTMTIREAYPVSPGHTLVIPTRHVASFFELSDSEHSEVWAAVRQAKLALDADFRPDGFNIGLNVGIAAG